MKRSPIGISIDRGHGSLYGRFLYVRFGGGNGYVNAWWARLCRGPGNAIGTGLREDWGTKRCGHPWPYRCSSAYCGAAWCNAEHWPVFGWLFLLGHTLRIWLGPTYNRRSLAAWKQGLRHLRSSIYRNPIELE
jgi:hypothetical protein